MIPGIYGWSIAHLVLLHLLMSAACRPTASTTLAFFDRDSPEPGLWAITTTQAYDFGDIVRRSPM